MMTMHNAVILTRENNTLQRTIDELQKRRIRALQNDEVLTVSEGRELAQASNEPANPLLWPIRMRLHSELSVQPLGVVIAGN